MIALTPGDTATLDLSEDSAGHVIFRVDREGSGSPVWSLEVREAAVTAPLLIDPTRIGLSYVGMGSVVSDPYGANLKTNQVAVRAEVEAKYHVRNSVQGAYVIA